MNNIFEQLHQNIENSEYYEILEVDKNSTEEQIKNITGTGSKVITPKGKLFFLAFRFPSFITF